MYFVTVYSHSRETEKQAILLAILMKLITWSYLIVVDDQELIYSSELPAAVYVGGMDSWRLTALQFVEYDILILFFFFSFFFFSLVIGFLLSCLQYNV